MGQIRQLSISSHENAVNKGFYDLTNKVLIETVGDERKVIEDAFIAQRLMLITSELGEALEALRKGRRCYHAELGSVEGYFVEEFKNRIKDTFEDELADAAIRLFDLCGWLDIDLEQFIHLKALYNSTREKMHGGKSF